jgi:Mrp family chromosome partitioning ATPase
VFAPPPFIPKPPATGVDFQQAPSTQRFGSLEESLPKTISPPPPPPSGIPRPDRPDTKYSFVDRSRTSRPPPVAERPSQIPNPTAARTRADASSSRPAAPVATQESIIEVAQPTKVSVRPPETEIRRESSAAEVAHSAVVEGEVWEKVSTRRPPAQELVVPQRVPSSWRFDAVVSQENGYAALTGLRDQIFGFAAHSSFVLGVTSESSSQEKKTDVAARITAMLSQDGRARVLLMEADFEHPTIHRVLSVEMPPGGGFSQQLRARLRPGPKKPWTVMRCTDKLDVLAEGSIRTPGVLMSQEFANAVAELRSFYDVIVIDSPVDGSGGLEMKPIDAVTDGIAIVAPDAASLREALDRGMSWFGQKKLMVSVPATGMP